MKKELEENPIILPENPYWQVFKRFGRDELIALVVNTLGTITMVFILNSIDVTNAMRILILAITGPIVEKVGFFPGHFWEAWKDFNSLKSTKRHKFRFYLKRAVKNGSVSLLEDILIHDPLYIGFMALSLNYLSGTPEWLLAVSSFVIAVLIVTFLEVTYFELRYLWFKFKKIKKGFSVETFYESRFLIDKSMNLNDILKQCGEQFNLSKFYTITYYDTYYLTNLPTFSGRVPVLRLRSRDLIDKKNKTINTAQIVYTRANEFKKDICQHRYFITKKEKIYYQFNNIISTISDIKEDNIRNYLIKCMDKGKESFTISFKRKLARHTEGIFISIDESKDFKDHHVVELKTYKNKRLLKESMRYVMTNFPVVQTTHNKFKMFKK